MDYIPFLSREPTFYEKAFALVAHPFNAIYHPIQALISLPALSFLIIPVFSSYSTTLNFLFFYMTWTILIRTNPPLQVELLGTLAIRVLFYLLPSSLFLAFDSIFADLAKHMKEHGEDALATGEEQGGLQGRWWKITFVSILNVLLSVLLQTGVDVTLNKVLGYKTAIKISTTVPLPWSVVKDLALGLLLREILTYALHRYVLHAGRAQLSKWHKDWQHSIQSPFSFVAHYDHPLPYLLHVFLPMYIPAVLLRMHLLTYHIYLTLISVEETFAYSGYNVLPTAFILGGMARRQERHLIGDGDGNFGCFGLTDLAMGTSLGDDIVDNVVDEAEEKRVPKRAKGKAKAIKNKAQKRLPSRQQEDEDGSELAPSTSASRSRSRRRSRGRGAKSTEEKGDAENNKEQEEKPKGNNKRRPPKLGKRSKKGNGEEG